MHSFATETTINAPIKSVWEALADIGNIYQWNPGVVASHTTSSEPSGLGATRYCDLGGKNCPNPRLHLDTTGPLRHGNR